MSRNTSDITLFDRIAAALIFFTRLPLWRIIEVPADSYKTVVTLWPYVGWLTGGITALSLWIFSLCFPTGAAVILAFCVRLLLTGALHEDGFADFCDGMGGGTDRDKVLTIMKDSHIGTYGVIGLIVYYALLFALVSEISVCQACFVIFAADSWSKFCSAQIINFLPYARLEAKNKIRYERMSFIGLCICFIGGVLPLLLLGFEVSMMLLLCGLFPAVASSFLILYMKHRIEGYTGDCCGATFIMSELSFYLGASFFIHSIL